MIADDLSQQTKTEIYLNLIIFNSKRKYSSRLDCHIRQCLNEAERDRDTVEKITFFLAAENISLNCITLSKKLSERTSSLTSVFDFAPKKNCKERERKRRKQMICFNVATFKNNCFCFLFCFHSSRVHVIKCCVQFNRSKNLCYTTHVRCALYTVQCGMVSCTCAFP